MLYPVISRRLIADDDSLYYDGIRLTIKRIQSKNSQSLKEYQYGLTVEYRCSYISKKEGNPYTAFICLLERFSICGVGVTPIFNLSDVFCDNGTTSSERQKIRLSRAYRRSVTPIFYIEIFGRLQPIFNLSHIEHMAELYNQSDSKCQYSIPDFITDDRQRPDFAI